MAKRSRPGGRHARPTEPGRPGSQAEEAVRVAERLAAPSLGSTRAGLPLRVPRAHLVPGAFSGGDDAPTQRSAEEVRGRLNDHQEGVRRARHPSP